MKSRIVLIALGLVVLIILFLIYRRDGIFHSQSTSSTSTGDAVFHPRSTSSDSTAAELPSSRPTSMEQIGTSGTGTSARPVSPAEIPKLYLKLTESSDPAANRLFKDCFQLMDRGDYREAKEKLGAFMEGKGFKGNELTMPPAWWMFAWCILNEGGNENLIDAAERFWICANLPGIGEYQELGKAAVLNRAVIYSDLLNTAGGEQEKYTEYAVESLNLFLERWPNDPQASEATNMLNGLNRFKAINLLNRINSVHPKH